MKRNKRWVSMVLAVAMLLTSFAVPKTAIAAQQSKQYVCDGFNVDFKVTDEYENKFHADVTVTNTGKDVLRDWAFSCEFVHDILNIWNACVLKKQDEFCVIRNADWNQNLAPGESTTFGFIAEKTPQGEIVFPENFVLVMTEVIVDPAEFAVDFMVYSDWGAGNNGAFVLKNLTGRRIHNWTLSFAYDRDIVSIANAEIVSYVNGIYTLRNAGYNADLEPYGTVHISFNGGLAKGEAAASGFGMTETVFELESHTNVFEGTVTDVANGKALAGALVQVYQAGELVATATTDANGMYFLTLHKGNYLLRVEKEHYLTEETEFVIEHEAKAPNVAMTQIAYKMTGVVTDAADGTVLSGAQVTVTGENGVAKTVTDENGEYSFDLYYGSYTVVAEKENYYNGELVFVSGANGVIPKLALTQIAYGVTGVVTDGADGSVLSGAKVTVTGANGFVAETVTNENGVYSFDLNNGEYTVFVEKEHYYTAQATFVSGPDAQAVDVALTQIAYRMEGKVIDEVDGKALSGVKVTVTGADGFVAEAVTDENGAYFFDLYYGSYMLLAEKDEYHSAEAEFVSGADGVVSEVALNRMTYTLTGVVTHAVDGKPISGIKVTVTGAAISVEEAVTDENGVYTLELYPEEYDIEFSGTGYISKIISVKGGETVNADVALMREICYENGYTVDKETGEKLAGIKVTLLQNGKEYSSDVTDENGAYSVAFYPGEYTVIFESLDFEDLSLERNSGETLQEVLVELTRSVCVVSGKVFNHIEFTKYTLNQTVKVYAGSFKSLAEISEDALVTQFEPTSKTGEFSIELLSGPYTFVCVAKNNGIKSVSNVYVNETIENHTLGLAEYSDFNSSVSSNWRGFALSWTGDFSVRLFVDVYEKGELLIQRGYNLNSFTSGNVFNYRVGIDDAYYQTVVSLPVTPSSNFNGKNYTYTFRIVPGEAGVTPEEFMASGAALAVYRPSNTSGSFIKIYDIPQNLEESSWHVFDIVNGEIVEP